MANPVFDKNGRIHVAMHFQDTTINNTAIGDVTPSTGVFTELTSSKEDSGTNTIVNGVIIGHESTGTPAAGLGAGVLFQAESTTTAAQSVGRVYGKWATATHASRKGQVDITAFDNTAERVGFSVGTDGSAAKIGFFGTAPVVKSSAYTPSNVTPSRSFDADTANVAALCDVVGTLIADLQAYGLIA